MKTDKKIKKALQKDLRPKKSFDAFCADNDITVEAKSAPRAKTFSWKKLAIPLAAVAAVLCVVLPITLARGGDGGSTTPSFGTQYNVGNEVTKIVDFTELKSDPDLVLYNTDYEQSNSYSAYLCAEEDDLLLAYIVKNVIYGGQIDGTLYAYTFDFLARCYDGYAESYSLVLDWYKHNGEAYVCNGVRYYYGIVNGQDGTSAVICYENGKYDYFVRMRTLNIGFELNQTAVKSFIDIAFGEASA